MKTCCTCVDKITELERDFIAEVEQNVKNVSALHEVVEKARVVAKYLDGMKPDERPAGSVELINTIHTLDCVADMSEALAKLDKPDFKAGWERIADNNKDALRKAMGMDKPTYDKEKLREVIRNEPDCDITAGKPTCAKEEDNE